MAKKVKVEGRIISVPDDATPDEIDEIANPGRASSISAPQIQRPKLNMEEYPNASRAMTVGRVLSDVGAGAVKGLQHTTTGLRQSLRDNTTAIGKRLAAPEPDMTPTNTAQKAGYIGEQIGEYLVPAGIEKKAGALATELVPKAARLIAPATRVGAQAIDAGAINKAQGGDFGTGAASGVVSGVLGEGMRAVAPKVAETALGITKRMRGYGKTPGEAVLNEIRGIRPDTILANATNKARELTADVNNMAASHPNTVSLGSAIQTIDDEIAKATRQNNATAIDQLNRIKSALTEEVGTGTVGMHGAHVPGTGTPIPVDVPASQALDLKRGVREQFVKNWNPELMTGTRSVAARTAGAIDRSLDAGIGPEFSRTNQRLSSLIPVVERAESLERDPSLVQRMGHRVAAHTGALAGAGIGGFAGYREGGLKGGVIGTLAGIAAPEMMSSPATQMTAARILNSPITPAVIRGAGIQAKRSLDEDEPGK